MPCGRSELFREEPTSQRPHTEALGSSTQMRCVSLWYRLPRARVEQRTIQMLMRIRNNFVPDCEGLSRPVNSRGAKTSRRTFHTRRLSCFPLPALLNVLKAPHATMIHIRKRRAKAQSNPTTTYQVALGSPIM